MVTTNFNVFQSFNTSYPFVLEQGGDSLFILKIGNIRPFEVGTMFREYNMFYKWKFERYFKKKKCF